ncbi:PASTA domain-containing protein [Gemmatimonadota bacterium]
MKLGSSIRRRRGVRRSAAGEGGKRGAWSTAFQSSNAVRWTLMALGIGVVGFGGGYLFSTRVLFPAPPPPGDLLTVPDLRGQALAEAEAELGEAGLFLGSVDSIRHPVAPEGEVLGQSPLPGQLSLVGDTVRVAISLGPERRPVPDVMRLRAGRAVTVLEAAGFSVRLDSVESDLPRGGVVEVDPVPGTQVQLPTEVYMRVSLGPPLVEVPLLLGLDEEEARESLESVGLAVGEVSIRFRFGLDQGRVLEQEPSPGTMVEQGSAVRLVVGQRGL